MADDSTRVARAKQKARERATAARQKAGKAGKNRAVDFVDFIRARGIVGMAVGLAIGTVASGTIKTIVEGFVTPLVQFIVGTNTRLEAQEWHVQLWGRTADFQWGAALSALITLVATVFVIYVLVKVAKLDKLDKKDV